MIDKFKFRCYKVLPLVYDETLSYYEVLCKLTGKIDECIDAINEGSADITQLTSTVEELQGIVQTLQSDVEEIKDELSIKGKVMVDSDIAVGNVNIDIANVDVKDCTLVKVSPKDTAAPAIICGVTIDKGAYDCITGVGYDIADNGVRYVINLYINSETNKITRNRSYKTTDGTTQTDIVIEGIEAVM